MQRVCIYICIFSAQVSELSYSGLDIPVLFVCLLISSLSVYNSHTQVSTLVVITSYVQV